MPIGSPSASSVLLSRSHYSTPRFRSIVALLSVAAANHEPLPVLGPREHKLTVSTGKRDRGYLGSNAALPEAFRAAGANSPGGGTGRDHGKLVRTASRSQASLGRGPRPPTVRKNPAGTGLFIEGVSRAIRSSARIEFFF